MATKPETLDFAKFAARYCERQASTPEQLREILQGQIKKYQPAGFMLFENQVMDSSEFGRLRILPYGPNNSYKEPPTTPVGFDGLGSTTSIVVATLPATDPMEIPFK